jgi:hypothetical protein
LWFITRKPRYIEELWNEGRLLGRSLSSFLEELAHVNQQSQQQLKHLKLTLPLPLSDTKITIRRDYEDLWSLAKELFIEKIKEARAQPTAAKQKGSQAAFQIYTEPIYEDNIPIVIHASNNDDEINF